VKLLAATALSFLVLLAPVSAQDAEKHPYEGRKDLGNTQAGDGERYDGRG
jgi:hypothetical protein